MGRAECVFELEWTERRAHDGYLRISVLSQSFYALIVSLSAEPVLALLVAAIANEALLITAIALGQTQKEELTKHQFAAGSA